MILWKKGAINLNKKESHLINDNTCFRYQYLYLYYQKTSSRRIQHFQLLSPGNVGISSISVAELMYGVNKSLFQKKNSAALKKFLKPLKILPFDYNATVKYGMLKAVLEKRGTPIGPLDMLIAAHALSINAILVSNNLKEFNRVDGLMTENWIANT